MPILFVFAVQGADDRAICNIIQTKDIAIQLEKY